MAIKSVASVKSHFESGDRPTQGEFEDLIDTAIRATPTAIASAAEGGKTGIYQVLADADVTARSVGTYGLQVLATEATASALNALGISSVQAIFLAAESTASSRSLLGASGLGEILITVGSTASALSALGIVTASQATPGLIEIASQAEMEARTSGRAVDPSVMHYHHGMPKAIARITDVSANPQTVTVLYSAVGGVSAARNATGEYTIGWGQSLTNTNVLLQIESRTSAVGQTMSVMLGTLGATSVGALCEVVTDGAQQDCAAYSVFIFGDLA